MCCVNAKYTPHICGGSGGSLCDAVFVLKSTGEFAAQSSYRIQDCTGSNHC